MHLMLECLGGNEHVLLDVSAIESYLRMITDVADMSLIDGPHVHEVPTGVVAIAIWAESHASFHYVTETQQALIDLFSCKPFDVIEAEQATIAYFSFQQTKSQVIERGLEYLS